MNHKKVAEINYSKRAVNCSLIALLYVYYVCISFERRGDGIGTKKFKITEFRAYTVEKIDILSV